MSDPFLSIIIPAYNEESYLPATLSNLNKIRKTITCTSELIVVDNNSDDATAQIAKRYGAQLVCEPVNQISRARNSGAKAARGRWFLFLDADTILPEKLLDEILQHAADPGVIGGGTTLIFSENVSWLARAGLRSWNLISTVFKLAAGSVIWVRSAAFRQVGGFSESVYASEEIWFSIALKSLANKAGQKFKIISSCPAKTSPRKFKKHSQVRLILAVLMFFIAPWIIFSKKACRWYWYKRG